MTNRATRLRSSRSSTREGCILTILCSAKCEPCGALCRFAAPHCRVARRRALRARNGERSAFLFVS
jgi:hypothetical protein